MADSSFGDRGRDSRRKKFFPNREREERNYGSRRLPIILTKPEGDREGRGNKGKPQENAEKPLSQPTIILRTRDGDNRAVSPSQRSARSKKESDTPAPLYHLAPKSSSSENTNALALPVEMEAPVSLIDEQFQMVDACLEFLTDQTDFIVIGCIGIQGVGKSTLLSHLAGTPPSQLLNTTFKTQSEDHQMVGSHCTTGVDFYVTPDRVIFLDCQPVLSASVMDVYCRNPQKIPPTAHNTLESMPLESTVEVLSLQLAAFLMSVCHVVLFVQDSYTNPNLIRFVQTAAMLKPPTNTSTEEGLVEYFPQIMFVHTHCDCEDFTVKRVSLLQEFYKDAFSKSMLQLHSGLGIANGGMMKTLSPFILDQEPLNLFLLPSLSDDDENGHFRGHPGYEDLVFKMRQQLKGIATLQLTTSQLSEKNWFHYSMKVWEGIKKSSFFQEYSRLLP